MKTPDPLNRRHQLLETLLEPVFIASNYMADDGRPLAELNATNRVKKDINFEMRRCPYSGSRFEKDMNVSALASLAPQIKTVISDTITLRNAYLEHIGENDFSLLSFWKFSRILDTLPVFMVRKAQQIATDNNIPARISAMFKAAQGLHLAPEVMILSGMDIDTNITVEQLLDIIEGKGLYLMDETRACAGPPAMIKAFVESAVEGKGKNLNDSWLETLLKDTGFQELFAYCDATTSVFATKILFEAEARLAAEEMLSKIKDADLHQHSQPMLRRFGSLQTLNTETLSKVKNHFQYICQLTTEKPSETINAIDRFYKMLALRNPRISQQMLMIAAEYLHNHLMAERQWLAIFTQQQTHVLTSLGYGQPAPMMTSHDFSGSGYSLRDLLSHWLRIEIHNTDNAIIVKAGASHEVFSIHSIIKP